MNLTTEQVHAIQSGQPVHVTEPQSQIECVVVRADVYEKIKSFAYDDSEWTDDEIRALAAGASDEADSAGPIP